MDKIVSILARANSAIAVVAGLLLLTAVAATLLDVILRAFGTSLGGTDELSGYAMAISTAWGVAFALTERAHVRIDILRNKTVAPIRALFDAVALLALVGVSIMIAWRGWGVLSKTISNNARSNTALETPLWIPQTLWWSGWTWFAISATIMALAVLVSLVSRRYGQVDEIAGFEGEA